MAAFERFMTMPLSSNLRQIKKNNLNYLSLKGEEFFLQGIKLYQKCYAKPQKIYPSWEELRQRAEEERRIANEQDDFSILKPVVKLMKKKLHYQKSLEWYNRYNKLLQLNKTWARYRQVIQNDQAKVRELENLQTKWQLHGELSHYTSTALLFAADILEDLDYHVRCAQKEANRLKQNAAISQHFDDFLKDIKRQKQVLCEAMYARWKLALESQDMTNDDVTCDLIQQLNQLNVIQDSTWTRRKRKPKAQEYNEKKEYNEKLFIKFHLYIARHGSSALKKLARKTLTIGTL